MDEIQRLIMQVEGEAKLKSLNAELAKEVQLMNDLIAAQKKTPDPQYAANMAAHATNLKKVNAEIEEVSKALGSSKAMKTQGIQQLGFALQDFMSASGGMAQKINAVTNNLQMFALSMGVGGRWFVAITAAAISALQLFINNWDEIAKTTPRHDRAWQVEGSARPGEGVAGPFQEDGRGGDARPEGRIEPWA